MLGPAPSPPLLQPPFALGRRRTALRLISEEWTKAQRDQVACPGSTSVRWQCGDRNAACSLASPALAVFVGVQVQALTPTLQGQGHRYRNRPWVRGPREERPGLSSPILVSLEVASRLPASCLVTWCLTLRSLLPLASTESAFIPGVTFNPISFGFTRKQEQPFFDLNQARAIPLCLAWNHFRLIISDNLQTFVNFFEEEEEVAQL